MVKGSQSVVLGSMVLTVGNAALYDLSTSGRKAPAIKIMVGGFILTISLLALTDAQPAIGEGLAVLIAIGSVLGPSGDTLIKWLAKLSGVKVSDITPTSSPSLNPSDGQPK